MSIVICVVDRNEKFFMAADRRSVKNGVVSDNYQKIYRLKNNVYFGMTGIAEAGQLILSAIQKHSKQSVNEIIQTIDSIFQPNNITLTIMIAGKNEEGNFFIWQKNHQGERKEAQISRESIAFSINSNDHIELFNNYILQQLKLGTPAPQAISQTIVFASQMDKSISSTYTMVQISR